MRIFVLLSLLVSLYAHSQTENLITKKWIIDTTAMKPVIESRLNSNPNFNNLSESEKKSAVQTALNQIAKSNVEYKIDGVYYSETSSKKKTGKWKFDKESNLLHVNVEGKDLIYKIISVNKNELKLENNEGVKLYFKIMP